MDSNTLGLLVGLAIAVVVGFAVMTAIPADESTGWNDDVTPAPVPTEQPTPTPFPTPEPFNEGEGGMATSITEDLAELSEGEPTEVAHG